MAPRTLRWEDWPEADRALWTALVRSGGLLDDAGAWSHLRPATLASIQARYARWLAWLKETAPEVLALAPEQRATPARLLAWLELDVGARSRQPCGLHRRPSPRPEHGGTAAGLERAVPPAADRRPAGRPLDQHAQARPDHVDRRSARRRARARRRPGRRRLDRARGRQAAPRWHDDRAPRPDADAAPRFHGTRARDVRPRSSGPHRHLPVRRDDQERRAVGGDRPAGHHPAAASLHRRGAALSSSRAATRCTPGSGPTARDGPCSRATSPSGSPRRRGTRSGSASRRTCSAMRPPPAWRGSRRRMLSSFGRCSGTRASALPSGTTYRRT